jgi:MFS family permease
MLSSITPLGERGRGRRWGLTTAAYVIGSAVAAAAAGALAGLAGSLLLARPSVPIVAVALAVGVALDALGAVPGPRRQVDESWLYRYRGGVYGFGYGAQLGLGVVTLVTGSAVYVVLGAAFASASPAAGAAIGLAAGVLRGATLLSTWRIRDTARLVRFHQRMDARRRPARAAALAAQLALALVAIGALIA